MFVGFQAISALLLRANELQLQTLPPTLFHAQKAHCRQLARNYLDTFQQSRSSQETVVYSKT